MEFIELKTMQRDIENEIHRRRSILEEHLSVRVVNRLFQSYIDSPEELRKIFGRFKIPNIGKAGITEIRNYLN